MKTYGKQSARQRGDYVIHLRGFPGRYTWLHCATLNPADEKVSASQVRQRQRVMFYNDALSKSVTASGQCSPSSNGAAYHAHRMSLPVVWGMP